MLRVTTWQRKARLVIAVAAVALAIVVVLAFKKREPAVAARPIVPADPKAVVESAKGFTFRWNRTQEEVRIDYQTARNYADGSIKAAGVKITTVRAGGRTFIVTGKQGEIGPSETNFSLVGEVHVAASDGLNVRTERADYTDADALVRAAGPVEFGRGRMTGTGRGFVYAKNVDMLTIMNDATVHVAPDAKGAGAMDVSASRAEFDRPAKLIRFIGNVTVTRGGETIAADSAVAHLSDDEERVQAVELEGHARTTQSKPEAGGLKGLAGRAINLAYAADGETLEHAVVTGDASLRVAGDKNQADRQISANTLDVAMAPDGTTPTLLTARDNVQLALPGDRGVLGRTITAKTLDGQGEAGRGLTRAHFSGGVQFRERGGDIDRTGRADALDATLTPGIGQITEARFARGVRFEEKGMVAVAAAARYVLDSGTLELSGTEAATPTPHVVNDRISVYASRIDVTFDGPLVKAAGAVKSELMPPKKDVGQATNKAAKMPSMFKQDQIVAATSSELAYDGAASTATYSGAALLWQGETSIKAATITLNEKSGDLSATGPVVTTIAFDQEQKDKGKTRVRSTATAKEFAYEDTGRRATYTGDAHVTGPQGDMTAATVELYLKASGDELDRAEAYDSVTLRDQNRETRGTRMTYLSAGDRYIVTGSPVTIKDECNRETTGQKVTFDKITDTIVVDGAERSRTQTKSAGTTCP